MSQPTLDKDSIVAIDRQHVWHPYSSFIDAPNMLPVAEAHGAALHLSSGEVLLDGMSSWWCVIHGYNHPTLNEAAKNQIDKMSHVMFGGLTHQPGAELAKLLVEITPQSLSKVFFSDSGSVAVEVAIKMALQYWHSQGQPQRSKLLCLRNAYHGDTFGAMATCDPVNGMHHLFSSNLTEHLFTEAPSCKFDEPFELKHIEHLSEQLKSNHQNLAGVILEPIVQGAGGMRFYSPQYLKHVRRLCDQYNLLLITDEIATGFGRTGKLFACEHADIEPDILCLGKALTGGYMTMAATLCNDRISDGICNGEAGVFMHGPTFMGNPLAAATALASTQLLINSDWQRNIQRIETRLRTGLTACENSEYVNDVRVLGAIGVVEMKTAVNMAAIQKAFIERGVWLRPFGKLVYVMPPYIMTDEQLQHLTRAINEVVSDPALFSVQVD